MLSDDERLVDLLTEVSTPSFWQQIHQHHISATNLPRRGKRKINELFRKALRNDNSLTDDAVKTAIEPQDRAWERDYNQVGEMLAKYNSIRPLLAASAASAMLGELPFFTRLSIYSIESSTIAQTMSKVLGHVLTYRKANREECRLRITLDVQKPQAVLDGEPFEVSHEVAHFLQALVDAKGSSISMIAYGVRSRQIDKLVKPLRDLIERVTGKGCWIPVGKLWRN